MNEDIREFLENYLHLLDELWRINTDFESLDDANDELDRLKSIYSRREENEVSAALSIPEIE